MAVSDVIPQDGGQGNVKLHPYLITLVRWCVSCLWSTASVLLHRLAATPLPPLPRLPQITADTQPPRPAKSRAASSEHLHPEPRVECVVLHAPAAPHVHALDVIFVHGLYGSLGNTWRQGEWRTKYKLDPTKVPLRNHASEPCGCARDPHEQHDDAPCAHVYEADVSESGLDECLTFKQLNGCFNRILPNENSLITEQFYNNTLLQGGADRYTRTHHTQAEFVTELFKNDCDTNCDQPYYTCNCDTAGAKCKCNVNEASKVHECKCKGDRSGEGRARPACEAGCGCVCDDCYSHCWPRDWIKEDFPGARVISINYTSDPYLWRPLWVKGTKRLRLHERADQMMEQLLALGVGRRPIVWVGHSKGGLFIKQIYCEAYEAHLKINKNVIKNNNSEDQSDRECNINNNKVHNSIHQYDRLSHNEAAHGTGKGQNDATCDNLLNTFIQEQSHASCARGAHGDTTLRSIDDMNEIRNNHNSGNSRFNEDDARGQHRDRHCGTGRDHSGPCGCAHSRDVTRDTRASCGAHAQYARSSVRRDEQYSNALDDGETREHCEALSSNDEGDRAQLWAASRGFMFYSVPHRGSPLADIKAPLTSRSVELQEIAKDCPLVLALQARWLAAARGARVRVRSLVETTRTLMSVLWLRIVSEDSADAGVGVLHGVSVDHREICKPASRRCLLYTELARLIRVALRPCRCR